MNRRLREKAEYLLSKEKGTFFKDPGGRINMELVYPNTYAVGMSSLGFQGIYGLLNSFEDVVCERAFLPSEKDREEYARTGTGLFTLESGRPLAGFDIIAYSVSFENDYPNILRMMEMSRIPLRSSERHRGHPLLIMGGPCAFFNPEPLADFFDLCFIGEAEDMLPEFLEAFRHAETREKLLEKACGIEGIYVPRYYAVSYDDEGRISGRTALSPAPEFVRKRTVTDISGDFFRQVITTPEAEFSDMYLLEVMRGCIWSCRFCVAGRIYRPVRRKDLAVLKEDIGALQGRKRVGLIGPSLTDYPQIEEVVSMEGVDFSITSLRASAKSARLIALMNRRRSVSIAPEAGTERLRRVIDKRVTDSDIFETARLILDGGIDTLRLYFMIGLPTETREDIEGINALVRTVRSIS
ncbi:MAG: radical SAM protein, partial [Nitrospirae bacterium]|nr:radical SAM protein [Nitrospirota bacterium]